MKTVSVDLSKDLNEIHIHPFSDWHIGDPHCDMDVIQRNIAAVEEDPLAYVILNGDLINNATKSSVSDCYGEALTPMQQIELLTKLLAPIKDKILLMTQGNHEERTYKETGIDISSIVAARLGVIERYCKDGGLLFLRFGVNSKQRKQLFTIYAQHGSGGGRREGGKVNRLVDTAAIVDADCYIVGHTHLPFVLKEAFYRTDTHNSTVAPVEKLFVNAAAALKYGGYGQRNAFKPASMQNPRLVFIAKSKTMTGYC